MIWIGRSSFGSRKLPFHYMDRLHHPEYLLSVAQRFEGASVSKCDLDEWGLGAQHSRHPKP